MLEHHKLCITCLAVSLAQRKWCGHFTISFCLTSRVNIHIVSNPTGIWRSKLVLILFLKLFFYQFNMCFPFWIQFINFSVHIYLCIHFEVLISFFNRQLTQPVSIAYCGKNNWNRKIKHELCCRGLKKEWIYKLLYH